MCQGQEKRVLSLDKQEGIECRGRTGVEFKDGGRDNNRDVIPKRMEEFGSLCPFFLESMRKGISVPRKLVGTFQGTHFLSCGD